MRFLRTYIFYTIIFAFIFAGCSSDNVGGQSGAGKIYPVVTVSADIDADDAWLQENLAKDIPDADDLTLRISTADGHFSGVWDPMSEYFPPTALLPGRYIVEVFYGTELSEGFETPYFYGRSECLLEDGAEEQVDVDCRLSNTLFAVHFSDAVKQCFSECSLVLHSYGGAFIRYPLGESRYAFVRPGDITIGMLAVLADGRKCDIEIASVKGVKPGTCYDLRVDVENPQSEAPVVVLSFDERITTDDVKVALTPDFVAAPAPAVTCTGFTSGQPVAISEGQRPAAPLSMTVTTAALSRLVMTTVAPSLIERGWPAEIDLMADDDISALEALGLKITRGNEIIIDFTDLLPHLRNTDGLDDSFAVQAISAAGKTSEPAVLSVALQPVKVEILEVNSPVVGVNVARMSVICTDESPESNLSVQVLDGKDWTPLALTSVTPGEKADEYTLEFKVPEGTSPLQLRLLYCGAVRAETRLERVSPEFRIEVDAFALKAVVRIVPEDPGLLGVITHLAGIYAAGGRTLQLSRNEAAGEITVTGLKEKTAYSFRASVMDSPGEGDFTPAVQVVTESAAPLPNGNFETVNNKHVKYDRMPSGGRYSQNIVEIFNLQNYTDIDFTVPEKWANINAKTFNTRASNINTWYVIPAVRTVGEAEAYAGTSYAVRIDNVAWDNDGAPIADYLQSGEPYVSYSRNIPAIRYKAAGKLFIGSYRFDPSTLEETYDEGMAFSSRPSALNGFYRFLPAVPAESEAGIARVEVLGDNDEVIASGECRLLPATGYTAFTVPLVYGRFGAKARTIKVMLAASAAVGDIARETAGVVTVPDPVTSTSTGSSLWVDELTFSY